MKQTGLAVVLFAALIVLAAGCGQQGPQTQSGSSADQAEVPLKGELRWTGSYKADIQPIFDSSCVRCHSAQRPENGLRLDSYEKVMQGTSFGKVVVPGSAPGSTLVQVVQGTASEKIRMPHKEPRLTPNRIQNIVLWVEAGAKND